MKINMRQTEKETEIVIFGGTTEGRQITEAFAGSRDLQMSVCVASEYGAGLLPAAQNVRAHVGRMTAPEMEEFLAQRAPLLCVDATHPYAEIVTENIKEACSCANIPYLRVLRGKTEDAGDDIVYAADAKEAAEILESRAGAGERILVTTGSRDLQMYTTITNYAERLYVRVLPSVEVLHKCSELGFSGAHVIAMQGPFGEQMNLALLEQTGADWLVTKESGEEGGYPEKISAAKKRGCKVLAIGRPAERDANALTAPEAIGRIETLCGVSVQKDIFVIGIGPGSTELLTRQAVEALRESTLILGASRMLDAAAEVLHDPEKKKKHYVSCYKKDKIMEYIREHPEHRKIATVWSGDIGVWSGAVGFRSLLREAEHELQAKVHPVSGISSTLYLCNLLGIPADEVCFVSSHGMARDLTGRIREYRYVCAILGKAENVPDTAKKLCEAGLEEIRITVGERLSYPEERIYSGTAEEFKDRETAVLAAALFENPGGRAFGTGRALGFGVEDADILRAPKVPMTKKSIRILALSQLQLREDSVLYDIGAGTGSVSIEAALAMTHGEVFAFERKPEAVHILRENRRRFGLGNLSITEGEAPECLRGEMPAPTHVFIGGSGGKLEEIIRTVREKNPRVRIVITAVSLETIAQISDLDEVRGGEAQILQCTCANAEKIGGYHLMKSENPVYIAVL